MKTAHFFIISSFFLSLFLKPLPLFAADEVLKETWPNGQLKSEEPTHNGVRDGLAHYWWANGKEYGSIPWKNGEKNGVFQLFREDGTLEMELSYKMGKQDGTNKWFYPDGRLMDQADYENGLLHGTRIKYKKDGSVDYEAVYQNGKFDHYVRENNEVRSTKTIPNHISKKTVYKTWYKKPGGKYTSKGQSAIATLVLNGLIVLGILGIFRFFFRKRK